jgi:hypothetical protein
LRWNASRCTTPPADESPDPCSTACDLNRLLVRDFGRFPDLLTAMREGEIQRIYRLVTQWLATQAPAAERDWAALAAVIIGSVSHYWLLCDVFGNHPAGSDEERYVASLAEWQRGCSGTPTGTTKQRYNR